MPKVRYKRFAFRDTSLQVIDAANSILTEYEAQGFDLTLRQLYYQFVARGLIPNSDREYKKLGSIVNDARLAGMIDWHSIVDRTRFLRGITHWTSPEAIVKAAASSYRVDKWEEQPYHVEVWIEKDALVGVIENVCSALDVSYLSCRGYTSQSEMWSASQRLRAALAVGKEIRIFHLGDHDPSGIDMSRDIEDRLRHFLSSHAAWGEAGRTFDSPADAVRWMRTAFTVERIALTWDQIEQYGPPPNPAKVTDSRASAYITEHGYESWELDALEPTVIADLIREAVLAVRDDDLWNEAVQDERTVRDGLERASDQWPQIVAYLETL